jgi:hypothetical protein
MSLLSLLSLLSPLRCSFGAVGQVLRADARSDVLPSLRD